MYVLSITCGDGSSNSLITRLINICSVDNMIRSNKPYQAMMKQFEERLKRCFRDSPECESMDCPLGDRVPDDPSKGVEDGYLEITIGEMKEIFDPVINEIIRLVRQQIDTISKERKQNVTVSCHSDHIKTAPS